MPGAFLRMGAITNALDQFGDVSAGARRGEFEFRAIADDLAVGL